MAKSRYVPVTSLIRDHSIYPRCSMDDLNTADIVLSLRSGEGLREPIVADEASNRIVDGFHRHKAWITVNGADSDIGPIEFRKYANDGEMLRDAILLNSGHGRRLGRTDQQRAIILARNVGLPDAEIAAILHVPSERIERLALRLAIGPAGEYVPTKLGAHHLGGRTVTSEQLDVMRQMRGVRTYNLVHELCDLIETGVADLSDERLRSEFERLVGLLEIRLAA